MRKICHGYYRVLKPECCLSALLLMCLAATAGAGELRLNNGAILPGELSSIGSETLVWKADRIGDVTVNKSDVVGLQTVQRTPVTTTAQQRSATDCLVTVDNSVWSVDCGEPTPQLVSLTELHTLPPASSTTGKVTTALDIERGGNPSEEINFDLTARWLRPTHRHKVNVSVDYETSEGDTTSDQGDADYQFDLLRNNGWYWFGRTRYYRDEFETLQQLYAVGGGIGRDFTPLDGLTLSLQGGPIETHFQIQGAGWGTEPGGNVRWTADWDTMWHGIKLSHSGDLGWVFSIEDAYLIQTNTALIFPLYQRLIAHMGLDLDYTGLGAIDGSDYSLEWVLGLGYTW